MENLNLKELKREEMEIIYGGNGDGWLEDILQGDKR